MNNQQKANRIASQNKLKDILTNDIKNLHKDKNSVFVTSKEAELIQAQINEKTEEIKEINSLIEDLKNAKTDEDLA